MEVDYEFMKDRLIQSFLQPTSCNVWTSILGPNHFLYNFSSLCLTAVVCNTLRHNLSSKTMLLSSCSLNWHLRVTKRAFGREESQDVGKTNKENKPFLTTIPQLPDSQSPQPSPHYPFLSLLPLPHYGYNLPMGLMSLWRPKRTWCWRIKSTPEVKSLLGVL